MHLPWTSLAAAGVPAVTGTADGIDLTLAMTAVTTVMLVGVRVVGFLVVAPPFHQKGVPGTVKVALAMGLALAVQHRVEPVEASSTAMFFTALVLQALVGLALGFAVRLVISAVGAAGSLLDLTGGFQMAAAYDPASGGLAGPLQKFYELTAMTLLFVGPGYQLVLGGLVRSFDAIALDGGLPTASLAAGLTQAFSQLLVATLQIAGPLLVVLFLTDVGLGLLTRVSPQLNAFALGFPMKILTTLVVGALAYVALPGVVETLTGDSLELIGGVGP